MQTCSIKPINSRSKSLLTRSSQLSSYQENEEEKLQNNYKFNQDNSREQTDVSVDMVFRMKGESPKVYKRKQDMINRLEVTIEELVIGLFAGMISKFVTCPLSNITIRLQTTASSSSRTLVDQSQSRSRTPLQKPENHNNGQADDDDEEVTSLYKTKNNSNSLTIIISRFGQEPRIIYQSLSLVSRAVEVEVEVVAVLVVVGYYSDYFNLTPSRSIWQSHSESVQR
ncbi:hypothetical protein BY996DRAFT_6541887 [Phakopsora pachyrhizi]|nr:hypothetical protein BY996DRAFT_6541887 [Phakopsora pachyrhizi]